MQLFMMLAVIVAGGIGTFSLANSETTQVENTSSDERQDTEIRRLIQDMEKDTAEWKKAIADQDTVVQREMRLLDDTMLEKIQGVREILEVRLESTLGDDLSILTNEGRIRALEAENSAQRVEIQTLKERLAKVEAANN